MRDQSRANDRIYQRIARKVGDKIYRGELPEGARLPSERQLAALYGASRASVREALLSLQSSGLICVGAKTRARVAPINNSTFFDQLAGVARGMLARSNGVDDFQEVRGLFECGLARYAASHASPKEMGKLASALADNRRAISDAEAFAASDAVFHRTLAQIPRNPIFVALNNAFCEWLRDQHTAGAPLRGAARRAYEGHEEIYVAIAARDVEAADRAMADHLRSASDYSRKARSRSA
jgi:GntR family transcriptional repressor for pyruvate dehydrogenase complex